MSQLYKTNIIRIINYLARVKIIYSKMTMGQWRLKEHRIELYTIDKILPVCGSQ
jgi:hypothetical protein